MSTKIKAGTATSGAVVDADATGILELQSGSTPTTAITVDTSQNVGIGTSSPATKLDVAITATSGGVVKWNASGGVAGTLFSSSTQCAILDYATSSNGLGIVPATNYVYFATAGVERMRIDSGGNLLINRTGLYYGSKIALSFNNSAEIGMVIYNTSSTYNNANIAFVNPSNSIVGSISSNATTTAYNTSSDYRLKENIAPMKGALATVSALKPVTYNWKVDGSNGQGFIAHELQAVVPECVNGEKDAVDAEGKPKYQGIDTSFLVATLVAAIQELNAKVTALETQLGAK